MRPFRTLAVLGALLAFFIAILGSWIRINGAGMTCPDWPLCHGAVVPVLRGGVVLEWSHRAMVALETVVVLATLAFGWRLRRRRAGSGVALAAIAMLFAVQVLLGAATVRFSNSPVSVVLHWAAGMGLLAAFAVLATIVTSPERTAVPGGRTALVGLCATATLAFLTMAGGAFVSSSNAGLACPSFPACGNIFFGENAAQVAQMIHRLAAGAFLVAALLAPLFAARSGARRALAFALTGFVLAVCQAALGAANLAFGMPTALREMHAANAVATFVAFVIATTVYALDGGRTLAREPVEAGLLIGSPAAQRT